MILERNYITDVILHHRSKWCEHVAGVIGEVRWKGSIVVG